ncbi:tetratricopeptide repeat protein [Mucilaginibacter sabulilitoris]|uniref:Tetratricopeptide repeat protein n=1 Tax=Mucilaginibacter sabulilitoris TaxID=1173583 RepID=A0ABZ0TMR4_9SPHI|nr:tetratricopeptide repeat protein [Mucilaginibacter sabulilitoris]WPU94149.1 tetratricopeptide repeat protein [Mucilaginibacter sabulilitoris]
MKTYHKILLITVFSVFSTLVFGQDKDAAKALVKQGITLHDARKYDEAIAKYQEALKADPDNINAMYEMSFTMCSSGKSKDAIPYLEKLTSTNQMAEAFDLLGSTYDDDGQFDKAEACYKAGMKAFPNFQRLHFNMALAYLRQKKYPEAEAYAIEAIKLDPKHASSQRAYALATLGQNKKVCAVMAFCSFLLLEPQTKRSAEAYEYLDKIFKTEAVQKNILINMDKDSKGISSMSVAETSVSLAAAASKAFEDKNIGTPQERLASELKMIFETTGRESDNKAIKTFSGNTMPITLANLPKQIICPLLPGWLV